MRDLVCRICNALFSRYERRWTSGPDIAIARIGGLRSHGIEDAELESVGALVEAAMLLSFWKEAA